MANKISRYINHYSYTITKQGVSTVYCHHLMLTPIPLFPPLKLCSGVYFWGVLTRHLLGVYLPGIYCLFSVNCEYGNEHNEHAVAVLKDGEIVTLTWPCTILVYFLVVFTISYRTSFFISFGHTTCKSFEDHHQTVLQLPLLMYFRPPPCCCYSKHFSP